MTVQRIDVTELFLALHPRPTDALQQTEPQNFSNYAQLAFALILTTAITFPVTQRVQLAASIQHFPDEPALCANEKHIIWGNYMK
jgi:hypothetical protein